MNNVLSTIFWTNIPFHVLNKMPQSFDKWVYIFFCIKIIYPRCKIFFKRLGDVLFSRNSAAFLHSAIMYPELHYLNGEHCVACRVSGGIRRPKDGNKSRCWRNPRRSSTRAFVFLFHSRNKEILIKHKLDRYWIL